jgi:hypothetical protein
MILVELGVHRPTGSGSSELLQDLVQTDRERVEPVLGRGTGSTGSSYPAKAREGIDLIQMRCLAYCEWQPHAMIVEPEAASQHAGILRTVEDLPVS